MQVKIQLLVEVTLDVDDIDDIEDTVNDLDYTITSEKGEVASEMLDWKVVQPQPQ